MYKSTLFPVPSRKFLKFQDGQLPCLTADRRGFLWKSVQRQKEILRTDRRPQVYQQTVALTQRQIRKRHRES
jgi:hypothetical protein